MRVRLAGTLSAFGYFGSATASAYGGSILCLERPDRQLQEQCKMISHSAKSGPGLLDNHQRDSRDAVSTDSA